MKNIIRKPVFIIIALILLFYLIIYLIIVLSPTNPDYEWKTAKTAPQEYWDFFPENDRNGMAVVQTITLKSQHPITEFTFDNELFFIDVFKLNIPGDKSLNEIITSSTGKNLMTDGITYIERHSHLFIVNFKTGRNKVQHFNCNFYGAGVNNSQIRNDSIAYFHSNFKSFSINYDHSDTAAIWASTERRHTKIPTSALPIDILFIKRHGAVYLLIMSINESNADLPANKLYDIVLGK